MCVCVCVCSAANLRLALFNPMDRSLPGSSCPWDFPGGNTGVSCHFLLQGIVPTLGSNLSLLHRQAGSLPPSHLGSPYQLAMVTMTRYGVLTPIGPFMRYETCVSDNFVHCTEHSVPPGFICERICRIWQFSALSIKILSECSVFNVLLEKKRCREICIQWQ